jgi:erythritol transport system ATP-binding protein
VLPNLDLADNIFAGRESTTNGVFVNRALEESRSREDLTRLRKPMNVRLLASSLPLGRRQIVEVARSLDQNARVLILDEPTSALSSAEAETLFDILNELKRAGVTIIYISHRLHELLLLGDYFTVLRSGQVVGEAPRSEVTRQWIVQRMSGRDVETAARSTTPLSETAPLLEIDGLALAPDSSGENQSTLLREISFTIRRGEVLGIYGLLGSGRTELLEALAGFRPTASGAIRLNGRLLKIGSVRDAIGAGIHLVPEDRQRDGVIPELTVRENIALAAGSRLFLNRAQETEAALKLVKDLNIQVRDLELPVTALSGGNQQKVLIARCLMRSPSLLLLDEPTRGVDVMAKAEIHQILRGLAKRGVGILFSSSEIEETQALADRAMVLCQGRITATFAGDQLTDEALFAAASPDPIRAAKTGAVTV